MVFIVLLLVYLPPMAAVWVWFVFLIGSMIVVSAMNNKQRPDRHPCVKHTCKRKLL